MIVSGFQSELNRAIQRQENERLVIVLFLLAKKRVCTFALKLFPTVGKSRWNHTRCLKKTALIVSVIKIVGQLDMWYTVCMAKKHNKVDKCTMRGCV